VVLGGRDECLSAILRPDTAGDAAQSAFTTTLAQPQAVVPSQRKSDAPMYATGDFQSTEGK